MNNDKLKDFIAPIGLLFLLLCGIIYFAPKIYENHQGYLGAQAEVQNKQNTIQEKQAKIEQYRLKEEAEKNKEKENQKLGKPFYKPVMTGLDTEAVIAGEFTEILQLIRANQIKVRSIKYEYDPKDDTFVNQAGSQYNVARLNMEMVGNYTNYDNFLKEMFNTNTSLIFNLLKSFRIKRIKEFFLLTSKLNYTLKNNHSNCLKSIENICFLANIQVLQKLVSSELFLL